MSEYADLTVAAALERLPPDAAFFSILPLKLPECLRIALFPNATPFVGDALDVLPLVGDTRMDCTRGSPSLSCIAANGWFKDAPVVKFLPPKESTGPLCLVPLGRFGDLSGTAGGASLGAGVSGTGFCGGGVAGDGVDGKEPGNSDTPLGGRGGLFGGAGAFRGCSPNASDSVFGFSLSLKDLLAARSPGCCFGGSGGRPGNADAGEEVTDFSPLPQSQPTFRPDNGESTSFEVFDSERCSDDGGVLGSDPVPIDERDALWPVSALCRFLRRSISARVSCTGGGANIAGVAVVVRRDAWRTCCETQ